MSGHERLFIWIRTYYEISNPEELSDDMLERYQAIMIVTPDPFLYGTIDIPEAPPVPNTIQN